MTWSLDWIRFAAGGGILLYASWSDLRTRRVPNPTWLLGATVGLVLLGIDYFVNDRVEVVDIGVAILIMALAYGFWFVHLIAGGADAKALMMLALLVPVPVALDLNGRAFPLYDTFFPPTFVAFANSLLVFLLIPLVFLIRNVLRGDVRFPALLLGYTLPLDEAAKRFVWPMERVDEDGRAHFVLFASKMDAEEQAAQLDRLRALDRKRVWVTPKVPYMVPLLGGFVAAFLVGDLFTHFILTPLTGRGP